MPQCRSGYTCVQGACVSACNPPCGPNETCTDQGVCLLPPAPAPQYAAAPNQGVTEPPPPPEMAGRRSSRFHDGFYFRFGFGVGALSATFVNAEVDDAAERDVSGFSTVGELAFGGTPAPGLVIGGGFFGSNTPTVTVDDDLEAGSAAISNMAFFIDYYPMPDSGLHLGGGVGPSFISVPEDDNGPLDDYVGVGFGMHAAVGYEGWVGDQWGIGVQGRVLYSNATMWSASGDYDDQDVEAFVPGIMFTATCH